MAWIPGGRYLKGSDRHYPRGDPVHDVVVDGVFVDIHPVTNEEFAAFIAATGHITLAKRAPDLADYPGADPALLVPASSVFTPPRRVDLRDAYQ